MNIQELTNRIKEISLNHNEVNSFHIGNTWNQAVGKSSDVYPAVWQEMPILISYGLAGTKKYTFSLDVLMLPKQDDLDDELYKQSQCEVIADELILAFQKYIKNAGVLTIDGLTVKNLNADIACGVRLDIVFNTNRECDLDGDFKEVMVKL